MRSPFADAVLNRVSRRGAGLDLIEEIEDEAAESVDAAELLPAEPALLLQRMENRLIRHQRGDVSVGAEIAPWRSRVADALYGPLREEPDPITALTTARGALASLEPDPDDQRQVLIERHGNDFSPAELDSEVRYKKLVTVLGGGGGAGFVYIGGMQRLLEVGQVPDYMIGASIGSILGSLVARALPVPIEEYIAWAKTVSYRAILRPERLRRRHGLAGMFALRFDQFARAMLSRADGQPMRRSD
jgi:Patatin-like phospholipase